jgi:hypothetical protein
MPFNQHQQQSFLVLIGIQAGVQQTATTGELCA